MRLPVNTEPGLLVAFEGIDGCGKGTQIKMLLDRLPAVPGAVLYKQPGCTVLGNQIRDILFHSVTTHHMEPDAASLLFFASHIQGLASVVNPALKAGRVVVADRWCAYSDTVFGQHGLSRPISPELITVRQALSGPEPDVLFFFYGDPEELLRRATNRAETHESGKAWANVEKLRRIQHAYFDLFAPLGNVVYIHARDNRTPEDIFEGHVWPAVMREMQRKGLWQR